MSVNSYLEAVNPRRQLRGDNEAGVSGHGHPVRALRTIWADLARRSFRARSAALPAPLVAVHTEPARHDRQGHGDADYDGQQETARDIAGDAPDDDIEDQHYGSRKHRGNTDKHHLQDAIADADELVLRPVPEPGAVQAHGVSDTTVVRVATTTSTR